jgi:putative DNA methylase
LSAAQRQAIASTSNREEVRHKVTKRKLIEVALPLEAINRESAREKSIRHGHPSTLHLWWSRKPLATARAVLFAQLVDDPASRPEATAIADPVEREEWIRAERARLFRLIEQLVRWENVNNERLLKEAHAEILRSTGGNPPPILDPFAGGGTIPLEAQRLGLEAHASDLNPVAVLINKALIEIPPKFAGRAPVFPGAADNRLDWPRATGLAEDVRRYGRWMRDEAEKRIGHLYPKAKLGDGSEATVIAWIWARTVICPNPACGIEMPLASKWWLGKKKGKEAYVVPEVVDGPDGERVEYRIGHDPKKAPIKDTDGTVGRTGAVCVACGGGCELEYIRSEGRAGRIGARLIATVAEGNRRRIYLAPTREQEESARVACPANIPQGALPEAALGFRVQAYGFTKWADLFTYRQLTALTTFSDLVSEARRMVLADALVIGMSEGGRLVDSGTNASAYADAVSTYLGLGVSRMSDISNSFCGWENTKSQVRHIFTRQAISMLWDYGEAPPFGKAAGSYEVSLGNLAKAIDAVGPPTSFAFQADASSLSYLDGVISTDPPYYDNIGYSDLSDFFYIWLRRSLCEVHPDLLNTLLVPKNDELVANPYRHNGPQGAKKFFEDGFREVFSLARKRTLPGYPITVYYAFKQSESDVDGNASTGWQTLLEGMIRSGWTITGTWPMRSELGNRMRSQGSNALASSIVLALRPRPENAPSTERRAFLNELRDELPVKLRELQQGSIAPVDLAQAAIGPGMAVFSRYSEVLEPGGGRMSVRKALGLINPVLAEVLNEQEGDFDADTRWCLKWFEHRAFDEGLYGEAESLAVAVNATVAGLDHSGAVRSRGGKVKLVHPDELPEGYDPRRDQHITLWEVTVQLAKALSMEGIDSAGTLMARAVGRVDLDLAKELAYLAYSIAERKGWSQIALLFNTLGTTWSEVTAAARSHKDDQGEQGQLSFEALY